MACNKYRNNVSFMQERTKYVCKTVNRAELRVHVEDKQIKVWKCEVNQIRKDLGLHLILFILILILK